MAAVTFSESAVGAAAAIILASFVKGVIAFGFPLVATPLLALFVDVKTGIALSILPNIVMDAVQAGRRRGAVLATVRRLASLLPAGILGTIAGTWALVVLPGALATAILGVFVIIFVTLNVVGVTLRLAAPWEPWLSPVVGFAAGFLGGITNVQGTLLVIYFNALGMPKTEFVRSVSVCFLLFKGAQLVAVAYYGLLDWSLLGASAILTLIGLGTFVLGLKLQDMLPERAFNRAVLAFLGAIGVWLIVKSTVLG
jgi:uncharacterized membrane protein YfcA